MELYNLENPFPEQEMEDIERLFATETEHMAAQGVFQNDASALRLRNIAIRNMREFANTEGFDYDPFVPFLAITYFDRYISRHPMPVYQELAPTPEQAERLSVGLFIVCCVVLAWKTRMFDFSVPLFLEENQFNVEITEVERIERLILHTLDWRMQSVTAVCFLDFFISLLCITDPQQMKTLKRRSIDNCVLFMHYLSDFTRFKPSIIAAAAVIFEWARTAPIGSFDEPGNFYAPISSCRFVQKEDLDSCLNALTVKVAVYVAREY